MATELASALKVSTNDLAALNGMFAHEEGNVDFSEAELNASAKSVRSKIAASEDYFSSNTALSSQVRADFDSWIAGQVNEVFPNWDNNATAGTAVISRSPVEGLFAMSTQKDWNTIRP